MPIPERRNEAFCDHRHCDFSFIAIGHLIRMFFRWEVIIHDIHIPLWVSGIAVIIFVELAYMLWRNPIKESKTPFLRFVIAGKTKEISKAPQERASQG